MKLQDLPVGKITQTKEIHVKYGDNISDAINEELRSLSVLYDLNIDKIKIKESTHPYTNHYVLIRYTYIGVKDLLYDNLYDFYRQFGIPINENTMVVRKYDPREVTLKYALEHGYEFHTGDMLVINTGDNL